MTALRSLLAAFEDRDRATRDTSCSAAMSR